MRDENHTTRRQTHIYPSTRGKINQYPSHIPRPQYPDTLADVYQILRHGTLPGADGFRIATSRMSF